MMIQQSNDNATYSMWLGIATWVCHITAGFVCFTACLAPLTTIAGIVLGHMGFNVSKEMNLGRNEAIAGLVLNYLSLAMYVIGVVFGAALLGVGLNELGEWSVFLTWNTTCCSSSWEISMRSSNSRSES
ncbi:MAG: hypothetical protein Ct9H300mP10_00620 [Methanobacteriota archaeon]|nr:MAG: hypothetical protein Ct9H300mP10_00620 [Euryarchaeota archaeon]